jgi:type IV secretory pathway VirB10-like protein
MKQVHVKQIFIPVELHERIKRAKGQKSANSYIIAVLEANTPTEQELKEQYKWEPIWRGADKAPIEVEGPKIPPRPSWGPFAAAREKLEQVRWDIEYGATEEIREAARQRVPDLEALDVVERTRMQKYREERAAREAAAVAAQQAAQDAAQDAAKQPQAADEDFFG